MEYYLGERHEPGIESALVHRRPSAHRYLAGRHRRRKRRVAVPSDPRLQRDARSFGHPLPRGRRLSEAARSLAGGAPDILSVALEAGYGSHEAFTRAFREQFGIAPERLRSDRRIETIELVEPILMQDTKNVRLEQPQFVHGEAMLVAGLGARAYEYENKDGIPAQWQRFNDHLGNIAGEVHGAAYGVCTNSDATGFDYIAGVAVTDFRAASR